MSEKKSVKGMNKMIALVLGLVTIISAAAFDSAFAVDNVRMPDLKKDSSSLTVQAQYTDEDVTTPIAGMELTIYKVADVSVGSGLVDYKATKAFVSAGIDYNALNTASSIEAAAELGKLVEKDGITGDKKVSGEDGKASFGEVSNGMYLVMQTGASGSAEGYTEIDPYLVMLPQPLTDIGKNDWEYDVESIPKMSVEPKTIKITKKVNSKDNEAVQTRTSKFTYEILTELEYAPEDFAVVDNVPATLEIVDRNLIEVRVNDEKLSDEVRDKIISIEGNTLRVQPSEEQMRAWVPFEMTILFRCRFRTDITLLASDLNVVNVAGYEVKGEYYEPPGGENEAGVKGEFDIDDEDEDENPIVKAVKSVNTGDYTQIGLIVLALVAAAAAFIFILRRRRKSGE